MSLMGHCWTAGPRLHSVVGAVAAGPGSLVELLSPANAEKPTADVRWRSIWRRTDYLGFPMWSYNQPASMGVAGNPIDCLGEEVDETSYLVGVVSHSWPPRCRRYRWALTEVVRRRGE